MVVHISHAASQKNYYDPGKNTDTTAAQQPKNNPLDTPKDWQEIVSSINQFNSKNDSSNVTDANGAPKLDAPADFSSDTMNLILSQLRELLSKGKTGSKIAEINNNAQEIRANFQKTMEDIKKWEEATAKAKDKSGAAFGWILKAVALVAAVATGGAGIAGVVAVVTAVVATASTVASVASEIDKASGGKGFDNVAAKIDIGALIGWGATELAKEAGASDEDAAIIGAVTAIVATLLISYGAFKATDASKVVTGVTDMMKMARAVKPAVTGVTGALGMTKSAMDMDLAFKRNDVDKLDIKNTENELKQSMLQIDFQTLHTQLKRMIKAEESNDKAISKIIKDASNTLQLLIANMAKNHQAI